MRHIQISTLQPHSTLLTVELAVSV